MADIQAAIVQAWYRGAPWLWLLRPLELVFRAVAGLRRWAYRSGLLKVSRPALPVVVVGNITVGGTGKTPIVISLVEALQAAGFEPGVISRGYGASAGQFPHRVGRDSTSADCGDEPLMIYRRTGCAVAVAPARAEALQCLLATATPDIIICDDGLQHYALARDMEVAVLDAGRQIGNGFCLPAGPLREPPARLAEVDWLLYRGSDDPACGVQYLPLALHNVLTGEEIAFQTGRLGATVDAVAGIGQPQQFFDTLRGAGFEVVEHVFPDHHAFSASDFTALTERPVIMSEKDAVKCRDLAHSNMWYLTIKAQLPRPLVAAVLELARSVPGH